MEYPDLRDELIEIVSVPFVYESEGHWEWEAHSAGYWNIWVCLKGNAVIECDGIEYAVQPWTAFVFSDDSKIVGHSTHSAVEMSNFGLHIKMGGHNAQLFRGRVMGIQLHEVDTVNSLINHSIRLSAYRDAFAAKQLQALTVNMLGLLWRESVQPIQTDAAWLIYRQLDRIHAGQDMFRTVDELAAEANLSRIHYTRCFRQLTNESPNRYLILKRVERACVLLAQTNWAIDLVARSIGYQDIYFFSRQFRKVKECTPSQYRERTRRLIR